MSKIITNSLRSSLKLAFHSRSYIFLLFVITIVVAVRATLPIAVKWYANKQLDNSEEYDGSLGDVDLQLYKGAYLFKDVTISKSSGKVPVPFFEAEEIHFSLLWSALLKGEIVSEITFNRANINIVDGENTIEDQTGENTNWINLLNDLVPLHIDQLTINDSSLHFRNFEAKKPVNVTVTELNSVATNIANTRGNPNDLSATVEGKGIFAENGTLEYKGSFHPNRINPTFNIDLRLEETSILSFRNLISAYAPFDVESGNMSLTMELAATNGQVEGYLKPIITDLEIFNWNEDMIKQGDNPVQFVWENFIDLVSELLENQPKNQFATIIPITGSLDNPDTGNWSVFVNILKNAFIEALNSRFENTISLDALTAENSSESEKEKINQD